MSSNAQIGIEFLLHSESEFRSAVEGLFSFIKTSIAGIDSEFGNLRNTIANVAKAGEAGTAASFAAQEKAAKQLTGTLAGEAVAREANEEKSRAKNAASEASATASRVSAAKRASDDLAAAEARYNTLKVEYSQKGTKALLDDLKHLEDESAKTQNAINAAKKRGDAEAAALNQKAKADIAEQTRLMRQLAKDTEEVQHLGAGARSGILGVGRNLIFGVGEYTGQLKKLESEQKQIGEHMEAANKQEMAAREAISKAFHAKERGDIQEAEFEEIASIHRIALAESESDKKRLAEHSETIKKEIAETKELNEKSAEKSEGGLAGKFGLGGITAGIAGIGGLTAALGGFLEKGHEVAERQEELTIGFRTAGQSEEQAAKSTDKATQSARALANELALSHVEVEKGTAAYLKMGGSADNIAEKQKIIAAIAKKSGMDMEAAGKLYGKAMNGNISALSRYMPALKGVTDATEANKIITEQTAGTLAGMKDAADSPAKSFDRFKEVLSQFAETGGSIVFNFITPLLTVMSKLAGAISLVIGPIGALTAKGGVLGGIMKTLSFIIGGAVVGFGLYSAALAVNAFLHGENAVAVGISTAAKNLMNGTLLESATAWLTETVPMIASSVATWLHVAATSALGVAMAILTSPITLVIAGIALLVAGVIYAYKHFEGFHNLVVNVGNFLKNVLWPIILQGIEFWAKWLNPIGLAIQGFKALYEKVEFFRNIVDATILVVKAAAHWLGNLFGSTEKLTAEQEKANKKTKEAREQQEKYADALKASTTAIDSYVSGLKKKKDADEADRKQLGDNAILIMQDIDAKLKNSKLRAAGETEESLRALRTQWQQASLDAAKKQDEEEAAQHKTAVESGWAKDAATSKTATTKAARAAAKTYSETISAFLSEESNAVTLGVKFGGKSQEDSLASVKKMLDETKKMQGISDTDRLKAESDLTKRALELETKLVNSKDDREKESLALQYAQGLISKKQLTAKLEVLDVEHYSKLSAIDKKYGQDSIKNDIAIANAKLKIAQDLEVAKKALKKSFEDAEKAVRDAEVAQQKAHEKDHIDRMKDGLNKEIAKIRETANDQVNVEKKKSDKLLKDLEKSKNDELLLAGDDEAAKQAIRKQYDDLELSATIIHQHALNDIRYKGVVDTEKAVRAENQKTIDYIGGPFAAGYKTVTDNITKAVDKGTKSWFNQKTVAGQAMSAITSGFIHMLEQAVEKQIASSAITLATTALTNAGILATAAPAAAAESIATLGGAAASGSSMLLTSLASMMGAMMGAMKGFSIGGYTGDGSPSSIAGFVHGQEWVFDAQTTKRLGPDNLAALQHGGMPSSGSSRNDAAIISKLDQIHSTFQRRPNPQIMDQHANLLSQAQEQQNMNSSKF